MIELSRTSHADNVFSESYGVNTLCNLLIVRLHRRQNRCSGAHELQKARCKHGIQSTLLVCSRHATHILSSTVRLIAVDVRCSETVNVGAEDATSIDEWDSTKLLRETSSSLLMEDEFCTRFVELIAGVWTRLVEVGAAIVYVDWIRLLDLDAVAVVEVCTRCKYLIW